MNKNIIIVYFILYSVSVVKSAINLNSIRQSQHTTNTITKYRDTRYFNSPMGQMFMPLCGNGKLDNRLSYENYYNITVASKTFDNILQVAENMLVGGGNPLKNIGVKIFVDEVCDDGNRLDGDGCSADCLTRDKLDSACEINVYWQQRANYEAIAFDPSSTSISNPFIARADGIYHLTSGASDTVAMIPTLLTSKSFTVNVMIIYNNLIFIYSSTHRTVNTIPKGGGSLNLICSNINIESNYEPGYFYIASDILYLVVKDNNKILLLKFGDNNLCIQDPVASFISTTPIPPLLIYLREGDNQCTTARLSGNSSDIRGWTVDLCPGQIPSVNYPPGIYQPPNNFWLKSMSEALLPSQVISTKSSYLRIEYINEKSDTINTYNRQGPDYLREIFIHSQFYLIQMFSDIRSRFLPDVAPSDIIFIGDPLLYTATQTPEYACGIDTCALDLPTTYNILSQNPYADTSGDTFFNILYTLFSGSSATSITDHVNIDLTLAGYKTAMAASGYAPVNSKKQIAVHPITGSEWVIDGPKLIEISRRGASFEVGPGKCIPAELGLCPPCYFYQSVGPCRPCNSIKQSYTLEWDVQCGSCPTSPISRRLLGTQMLNVEFTIRGITASEITTLFPQYTSQKNTNETAFTISTQTSDPAATIRSIQVTISRNANWTVTVQPRIVYTPTSVISKPTDTSDSKLPIIAGAIGGTIFVVCLVAGLCLFYHKKDKHTTSSYSKI